MTTYTVSVISGENSINIREIGSYPNIRKAMAAAKKAAKTRKDSVSYGPTSIAYVGRDVTAVVVW